MFITLFRYFVENEDKAPTALVFISLTRWGRLKSSLEISIHSCALLFNRFRNTKRALKPRKTSSSNVWISPSVVTIQTLFFTAVYYTLSISSFSDVK